MRRYVNLLVAVVLGAILGNIVADIGLALLQVAGHPGPVVLQTVSRLLGLIVGGVLGVLDWRRRHAPIVSDLYGTAEFGSEKMAKKSLADPTGLIVGRAPKGWLMRYSEPAHLLTLAPTRSGKGVGVIIPNLLTANRSVICIDPKGENARITSRARAAFGPVFVLDPFEISGQPPAAFKPLAHLDASSQDLAEDVALVADALVYDPPGQVGEAHWNEEAKALIAGILLHIVTSRAPQQRSLGTLRDLLTTSPERFDAQLETMQKSRKAGGLVARAANRHLGKSDREAAGVLSSAQRHTHFLDSPRMVSVLSRADFSFGELRNGVATVFLVLPPDRLATHARWLRLLVTQALAELARTPRAGDETGGQVLFLLDEFAALGRLEPIERAYGLMAGYGVQLWAILQDIHQLKSLYGERSGTFLANAGATQVFNVGDIDTAKWVSQTVGVSTEAFYSTSSNTSTTSSLKSGSSSSGSSTTLNFARRDLMTPDEVMTMSRDQLLLLRPGFKPIAPQKVRYYEDAEFRGLFDS
jgi:type IV secretion system protein VirD4